MENKKILVIDDDHWTRKFIANALEGNGYEAILADNPLTGLNMAVNDKPDMIILDLMMPIMNGDVLLMILKTLDLTASIPVVILSGHLDHAVIASTYKSGAQDFITKPFKRETIIEKIAEVLTADALIDPNIVKSSVEIKK